MNRDIYYIPYCVFLYWFYRFTTYLIIGIFHLNTEGVFRVLVGATFGFMSDIWVIYLIPFFLYVFFDHVLNLQKGKSKWYHYFSWKPVFVSSGVCLCITALVCFVYPVGDKGRTWLRLFSPFDEYGNFWMYFFWGSMLFLTLSSLMWFYWFKDFFYDEDEMESK